MTDATTIRMTVAEFLALPETNQLRELIDGEIVFNPPKIPHQRIVVKGIAFFTLHVTSGSVWVSPTGVILDDINIVEPDIFWISSENMTCREGDDGKWYGAPDLIIEVLSPSTARNDTVTKFQLYEKYGVREYWIANPDSRAVEVWLLQNQKFVYQGAFTADKTFRSSILDLAVPVEAFFGA